MKKAQIAIANSAKVGGARFTEIMEGFLYVGDDIDDFETAVECAKGSDSAASFYLSVDAWDINTLIHKDNHAAMLTGTFSCGALSKDPFMVLRGEFQLFSEDTNTPDTMNLVYDFDMVSVSAQHYVSNFRRPGRLFISMVTRSWIPQSVSPLKRPGRQPPRYMSRSLVQINPS